VWTTRSRTDRRAAAILCAIAAATLLAGRAAAAEHAGRVTFSGLPVPGATVTAAQADTTRTTVTNDDGVYRFADLGDGAWTLRVEMLGFAADTREIVVPASAEPTVFTLTLLPYEAIASRPDVRAERAAPASPGPLPSAAAPQRPGGFQRAAVTPSATPAPRADTPITGGDAGGDRSADAADGFLINGSVNNSAASPFAQLPAFGNNRRGPRSLYNGGFSMLVGDSAFDARPFSFTDQRSPRPDYFDSQLGGSFGGPVKIPGLRNRANTFLGFQHTSNHDATTQSALVPTAAERGGDFSQSADAFGHPVRPIDPLTGLAFPGGVIPSTRISPQAASLLRFYPAPNVDNGGPANFQSPVLVTTKQDALQARATETLNTKNQLYGNVSWQRTRTESGSIFGFVDTSAVSGIDAPINWSHRISQFVSVRLRYQYTALTTDSTPFFANVENVSGDAGIAGNNQDPANFGPPTLLFSSGVATLGTAQYG